MLDGYTNYNLLTNTQTMIMLLANFPCAVFLLLTQQEQNS